ncbi:Mitochondrial dicarboxylate transporter [Penicillium chrysogenum]|uniref:Mitochondrial dicarboxylate transporter n=1 Tax=Penicillium chrysogenum TaxID=5076 RepID=A0A167R042_PENCH|nr:Mitochondrial dicarboxylate transporter [Penicillium chrysogenum]
MGKSIDSSQSILYPKWFGGSASCMAVLVSHPLDLIKVRMQMEQGGVKAGTLQNCIRIVQGEGVLALYNGVGLIKNKVTYGSVRIGLYETLKEQTKANNIPTSPPVLGLLAGISGFTGAIFGNSSDIGNIRMQNDGSLPAHLRRNYRHIFDAWRKIKRQEGWKTFGQGLWPNAFRCGMMTSCQLASYDSFRDLMVATTGIRDDHPGLHLSASFLAALVATTLCSPIDVIKTQLMGSSTKQGILHVMKDLTTTEGIRWVFRGWTPGFVRLGPQTMATLILLEQHKRLYRDLKEKTGTQKIVL